MTRLRVPEERDFTSRLRGAAVTARVGLWLGVCFGICFVTGLVSHWSQLALPPVPVPTSPSWGYRLTQGLHVVTGTAAVPLLLVKLWSVYPKLFERPPRDSTRRLALHGAERLSIGVLVAAAIFQLVTGLANASQWYPWPFSFRSTHYAVAWVAIGALVVHIAVKLPVIRRALGTDVEDDGEDRASLAAESAGLSRRGLLRATWAAVGVAVVATAGNTVSWLRDVSVLAVRSGEGPQGVPINKSAQAARVTDLARDPAYRLTVAYGDREVVLARDDLAAMEQATEELPIACVEGWSASGRWTGIRVRDLLSLVGAPAGSDVRVTSLQPSGPFRATTLPANFASDGRTLLALALAGEPLDIDHGYPCRIIAPNRPGVLQTKWVQRLEVLSMTRVLLALVGIGAAAYGVLLLLDDSWSDLVAVGTWLVGGVVLHDLLLAPVVIVLLVVAARLLPDAWRGPAAVALVVLGPLTLLAVPVLGRFGARPDNPTLLDRPYAAGWALVVGLTLLVTAAAVLVGARRAPRRTTGE